MMLAKQEGRPHIPRDGRHCDLCGCSQPAVRCDKCGCQIFCLSCDDMYHRHPKRRFHLRKAVDTTPATTQARPVLPAKAGHVGDPSKMPLPPPRKKKPGKASSFFDTFRRRSPSEEHSPPLPKKEYSWTDRFGNIKKFMSNRPLPPLPNSNGATEETETQEDMQSAKHDMSFIHKKVDEKPPQLPQRSLKPSEFARGPHDKENLPNSPVGNGVRNMRNGTLNPSQMSRNNGFGEENQWNNQTNEHHNPNTLMRQPPSGYMYPGGPGYPGTLSNNTHQSATDLHTMDFQQQQQGHPPQQYPPYPMPYPYPMYPQYPNYPQYFGNSFANLSSQPTTDGDFSDQSEASSRHHHSKRYPFRKRAKRSQSVLVDRMAYPSQFYPFGPFPPGYGPWGAPYPVGGEQAPPSPSSSIRSLNRIGRRRKKNTSDDEDFSSSPLSRPKSSSSERPKMPPVESSSEEEFEEAERERSRSRNDRQVPRRDSDPKRIASPIVRSPQVSHKKFSKHKKEEPVRRTEAVEEVRQSPIQTNRPSTSKDSSAGLSSTQEEVSSPAVVSSSMWECSHCTFINQPSNRICQVCCKTASLASNNSRPASNNSRPPSSRRQSASSEKSCSSPEKRVEEEEDTKRDKQDMAVLNSALDEAEKEISRGLEELMKLKEDFPLTKSESPLQSSPSNNHPQSLPPQSKPVYKSSGKMRTSILDKLNLPSTKQSSTETQTGQTSTTDRVIEARRGSTSSTTSDAYNSPVAQSPVDNKGPRKDSSCQTQTDELADYLERRKAEDEAFFGRPSNGYGYRYGDRVTSPVFDRGYPVMQRSHSRASLFTGRMNDLGPLDYGLGPSPMYRSVSRSSLTGDYPENSFSDFHNLRKPAYYLSMEELVERRRQDTMRAQGLELVRMIREAEQQGFTADDIQVALHNCGNQSPLEWLHENWRQMVEQVVRLAASYAAEKRENDVGEISETEARDALRLHKGNLWPSVTECVESRQRKFLELKARGKFSSKDITDAMSSNQGDVEMAYAKLTKSSSKPFLMRIWGAGEGVQNQDGAIPPATKTTNTSMKDLEELYFKSKQTAVDSDETWDEEEEDVEWDEDYEEEYDEEEHGDLEDLQTCHDDVVKTPDSDRSDYCDAFGSNTLERNMQLPIDEVPEVKLTRRGSFLSKLAGLKKSDKDSKKTQGRDLRVESPRFMDEDVSGGSLEQTKSYNPLSVIKNTISAIRDTVGGSKGDKKLPCAAPERRTIVVKGQIGQETDSDGGGVKLTSVKRLVEDGIRLSEKMNGVPVPSNVDLKMDKSKLDNNSDLEIERPGTSKDENNESKLFSGVKVNEYKSRLSETVYSSSPESLQSSGNAVEIVRNSNKQEMGIKSEIITSREIKPEKSVAILSRTIDDLTKHTENDTLTHKPNITTKQGNLKSTEIAKDSLKTSAELIKKEKTSSPMSTSTTKREFLPLSQENDDLKTHRKIESKEDLNKKEFQSNTLVGKRMDSKHEPSVSSKKTTEETHLKKLSSNVVSETSSEINSKSTTLETVENKHQSANENTNLEKDNRESTIVNSNLNEIFKSSTPGNTKNKNGYPETEPTVSEVVTSTDNKNSDPNKCMSSNKKTDGNSHIVFTSTNIASNTSDINTVKSKRSESIPAKSNNSSIFSSTLTSEVLENIEEPTETSKIFNTQISSSSEETSSQIDNSKSQIAETYQIAPNALKDKILSHDFDRENINDFKNIPKQKVSHSESHAESVIEESIPTIQENISFSGIIASELAKIPLIDEIDNSQETGTEFKNFDGTTVPKFKSMEPIHSSTFKKSSSLHKCTEVNLETLEIDTEASSTEVVQVLSSTITTEDTTHMKLMETETNKARFLEESSDKTVNSNKMEECGVIQTSKETDSLFSDEPKALCKTEEGTSSAEGNDSQLTKDIKYTNTETDVPPKSKESVTNFKENAQSTSVPLTSTKSQLPTSEKKNSASESDPTASFSETTRSPFVLETEADYKNDLTFDPTLIPSATQSSSEVNDTPLAENTAKDLNTKTLRTSTPNLTSSTNDYLPEASLKDSVSSGTNSKGHTSSKTISMDSASPASSSKDTTTSETIKKRPTPTESISNEIASSEMSSKDSASSAFISKDSAPSATGSTDPSFSETISKDIASSKMSTKDSASSSNDPSPSEILSNDSASYKTISKDPPFPETISKDSASTETISKDSASTESISDDIVSSINTLADHESHILTQPSADGPEGPASADVSEEEDDSFTPPNPVELLRYRFEGLVEDSSDLGPIRPASPFRRMSFRSRKEAIALERTRDTSTEKPWFLPKPKAIETKKPLPKRSLKQQMETDRKVRKLVADRKVRTYRKAEIVVQLLDLNFEEEEAILASNECSTFELALSYLQQECLLCTGYFPVSHIISMVHCQHKACRDCIRAYFTVQIRDRNIMELLCPFCNEPDIFDEDIAQDYFNHLDMMLKKLVDPEIHELFQRKLRDRVLMRDPSFRWCSKCSSGFLAMENLKRLVCPDCNAVTCASCRRPWEREHQGISCEAFASLKDGSDSEAQAVSLAKQLTEDGIDCPRCHFRYALAKGGCMHFRCIQCQHDFCSGCSRPFKMGQKCGVSEFCAKLGLHAHHPRNCLFYLRDKDPEDLQRLLDLSDVKYDRDPPEEEDLKTTCQVMEQKETSDGMVDDYCGKEVEGGYAGLCRVHYVEYLGQLVNKHKVDPIQIFENDDLELVLRRANVRLPPKRYRETDDSYRKKLEDLIHEELPLDKMDGS